MKKRYLDRLSEVIQAPASSPERLGLGPYGAQGKTDVEKFHGKREHIKRLDEFHLGPGDHPSGSSQDVHGGGGAGARSGVVARSVTDADVEKIKIESGSLESFAKDKLKKLPAEHIDRLEKIEFNEGGLIKTTRQNGESGNAYGTYEPAWNKITLAADQKLLSTAGTVEHEVGHHVHLAKMDTATAQEWASISDNGRNAKISAYARTCAGEHFAEVYRSYYQSIGRRKELQQWEPAAYDFMKNKIVNGKGLLPDGEVSFSSWEFRYNPERHANKYNRGGG